MSNLTDLIDRTIGVAPLDAINDGKLASLLTTIVNTIENRLNELESEVVTEVSDFTLLQAAINDLNNDHVIYTGGDANWITTINMRSNLKLDLGYQIGSKINFNGSQGAGSVVYLIAAISDTIDPGYVGLNQPNTISRGSSQIFGPFTENGRTFTFNKEYQELLPGTIVRLMLGPNPGDPAEPYWEDIYEIESIERIGIGDGPAWGIAVDGVATSVVFNGSYGQFTRASNSRIRNNELLNLNPKGGKLTWFIKFLTFDILSQILINDSVTFGDDSTNGITMYVSSSDFIKGAATNSGVFEDVAGSTPVCDGQPHTAMMVYKDSGTGAEKILELWLDGEIEVIGDVIGIDNDTLLSTSGFGTLIGTGFDTSNSSFTAGFNGRLWHCGIALADLSAFASEIHAANSFEELPNAVKAGLKHYYPLKDNANDQIGEPSDTYEATIVGVFGIDVPTFATLQDFKDTVDPSYQYKCHLYAIYYKADGTELTASESSAENFGKGFGLDGGMTIITNIKENFEINYWHFNTTLPIDTNGSTIVNTPQACSSIQLQNCRNVSLNHTKVTNQVGTTVKLDCVRNFSWKNREATGTGVIAYGSDHLFIAHELTVWSGHEVNIENSNHHDTINFDGDSIERGMTEITRINERFDNIGWNNSIVVSNNKFDYSVFGYTTEYQINGFYHKSDLSDDSQFVYFSSGMQAKFTGLVHFDNDYLVDTLIIGGGALDFTSVDEIRIGIVGFGPLVNIIQDVILPAGDNITLEITMPQGLYENGIIEAIIPGDCNQINDLMGNHLEPDVFNGPVSVRSLTHPWSQITQGTGGGNNDTFPEILTGVTLRAVFPPGSTQNCTVRLNLSYWPKIGAPTLHDFEVNQI